MQNVDVEKKVQDERRYIAISLVLW